MAASGRKRTFVSHDFQGLERLLSVNADIKLTDKWVTDLN
jgi:hypothetical protein